MALSAKTVRKQISVIKSISSSFSLKTTRKGQNMLGEIMEFKYRHKVILKKHSFTHSEGSWVIPKDERREGVILYLHGGGYTCGDLEYATGFGSTLAVHQGTNVFCLAYRLAPENPFPAALDDALEAYRYLLSKGYGENHITLCGESSGGGLCYSLCLKLREEGLPLPAGIIAISPWTDLTHSGKSYEKNRDVDPSMTIEKLEFFADSYTDKENRENPLVSPIFADLSDMPPSLIFVGEDEIMLSDSLRLSERLTDSGVKTRIVIAKDRWHAYLLYDLLEDKKDQQTISRFLNQIMAQENKLRWMRLDNAAKIYPAARNQNWSNVFRLSCTLTEDIDRDILQSALDITVRRFPSMAVRLRRGLFWYYLEQISEVPDIKEEYAYPLTRMSKPETSKCALRVIAYKKRIAVEIFHSLTDGTGALIFLKSLVAEYLQQKYEVYVPAVHGVLGRVEEPSAAELEDSFQKYGGKVCASRKGNTAWRLTGTPEPKGFLNLTCFKMPTDQVLAKSKEYGVSLTNFVCAAIMMAIQNMQKEKVPVTEKRKPIKILIPVNLRNLFESRTLRNFAMYATPEIMPMLGEYDFKEICEVIRHCMGAEITPKYMSTMIATNIKSERIMAVRVMPLFIKNLVMKAVFRAVGEKKSCMTMSNLGAVRIPEAMSPYVERFDFILGVQSTAPYNCGIISYKDTLYINFIRNIKESEFEYAFYKVMRDMGINASVETNLQEN